MARVTTYGTLATAVQDYLSRTDVGVSAGNLDYLLSESEEEMNARLRVRYMLTAITPTVSSAGVITLPTGFLGWKRFQCRDGTREWDLDLKDAEELTSISDLYGNAGIPEAVITTGTTSQIWPYTDATYTFRGLHYLQIPQLTSVATTNWVITNYPNAYLYGCLAAARAFVKDDTPAMASRFDLWQKRFDEAIDRINTVDAIDLDARTHAQLGPDTSMFRGSVTKNIRADE
jgi:hypothetical protein